ncbi:S8 family serine peptidase [Nonomuraea maritima]|uniref:S8 family serine peptidase n=1 Tax=Nonomuraea maritima TaxID=683260 RepID=UPI00371DEE28
MLRRSAAVAVCATVCATGSAAMLAPPATADDVRGGQRVVIETLRLAQAWRISRGSGVTVAVLDSGVDPRHPDLAGSVRVGRDFTAGANPRGTVPRRLHGTYMASLIAGHGHGPGGERGIIGAAPEADVLSVRVILEDDEPGRRAFGSGGRFENVVARGIRYAVDEGADVINLSISKQLATRAERAAVRYAIARGVVLVAAAGNEGDGATYSYPAALPGVVSVAATDRRLRRAAFSNRNSSVLVAAPGVDIMGAGPGGAYWVGRGTSQATALVSGVAALVRARYPTLSPPLVARALAAGATDLPPDGYDTATGFGVVDAARALAEASRLSGHTEVATGPEAHDPARPLAGAEEGPVTAAVGGDRLVTVRAAIAVAGAAGALVSLSVVVSLLGRVRRAQTSQGA